jgi:hypothetical protein
MTPSRRRIIRWAAGGALILAGLSIVLGTIFTVVISIAEGSAPRGGPPEWAGLLLVNALIWGGGGLFFGSLLGLYASLIWRDPDSFD